MPVTTAAFVASCVAPSQLHTFHEIVMAIDGGLDPQAKHLYDSTWPLACFFIDSERVVIAATSGGTFTFDETSRCYLSQITPAGSFASEMYAQAIERIFILSTCKILSLSLIPTISPIYLPPFYMITHQPLRLPTQFSFSRRRSIGLLCVLPLIMLLCLVV